MKTDEPNFLYVGARPCGCVVAVHTVTSPHPKCDPKEWREGLAACLSEWIMEGYTVHFMTKEAGLRLLTYDCNHADFVTDLEALDDAYQTYLNKLRFSNRPVLELQQELAMDRAAGE